MATRNEILKVIYRLISAFGKKPSELSEAQIEIWVEKLSPMSGSSVAKAAEAVIETKSRFPSISDLFELCSRERAGGGRKIWTPRMHDCYLRTLSSLKAYQLEAASSIGLEPEDTYIQPHEATVTVAKILNQPIPQDDYDPFED